MQLECREHLSVEQSEMSGNLTGVSEKSRILQKVREILLPGKAVFIVTFTFDATLCFVA